MNSQRNEMKAYLTKGLIQEEGIGSEIYVDAYKCRLKYSQGEEPTKEEKVSAVVLGNGYLAHVTKAKRLFVDTMGYELNDLWGAFIDVFLINSAMYFNDSYWSKVIEFDQELKQIIAKTSNPKRTLMALKGFDFKQMAIL